MIKRLELGREPGNENWQERTERGSLLDDGEEEGKGEEEVEMTMTRM